MKVMTEFSSKCGEFSLSIKELPCSPHLGLPQCYELAVVENLPDKEIKFFNFTVESNDLWEIRRAINSILN